MNLNDVESREELFEFDSLNTFNVGEKTHVCGNTYKMLKQSRLSKHFIFSGDFNTHHGLFGGLKVPFKSAPDDTELSSCCPPVKSSKSASGCCPTSPNTGNSPLSSPPKSR